MCRIPGLPEKKLATYSNKLFEKRFKNRDKSPEVNLDLKFNMDAYHYTFSLFSDWTGPINYYRNLDLSDYGQMDTLSDKMSSQVETLLIVGNEDTDVSLDLITKSAQIPERCAVHIVNGGGHFPHQEQPSYCNKIIYRFIQEFDDKSKGTQTNKPLEEEIMNNNDDEGSSLYQMSVGKLMHLRSMSSTDTSDSAATTMTTSVTTPGANTSTRLEELDNTGPEQEKQKSIL